MAMLISLAAVMAKLLVATESGPSEAEEVVRVLIFVLGGLCVGTAVVYGAYHVGYKQPRPVLTVMQLVGVIGLALLTGQHVLSHLQEGTAPVWQLWGALTSFTLLAISFTNMVHRREVAVTKPTVDPGTEDGVKLWENGRLEDVPEPLRRAADPKDRK